MRIPERRSGEQPEFDTAFVLGGGGALGAVQVGMLRALLERGIVPDLLVGCSVGALNAAFLAQDPSIERVDELEVCWRGLQGRDVFGRSRKQMVWNLVRRSDHIYEAGALRSLIAAWIPLRDLAASKVHLEVVTTDLDTGESVWHSRGAPAEVLAASACVPGVFPPVEIDGHRHVDGGVLANLPVSRAVELGARRIYVLSAANPPGEPAGRRMQALDVLLMSFSISRRAHVSAPVVAGRGQEVVHLPLVDTGPAELWDFSGTATLIQAGYAASGAFLDSPAHAPRPLAESGVGRVRAALRRAGALRVHLPRRGQDVTGAAVLAASSSPELEGASPEAASAALESLDAARAATEG